MLYDFLVSAILGLVYCVGFFKTSETLIDKSIYECIRKGEKKLNTETIFIASLFFPLTWALYALLALLKAARTLSDEN